MNETIYQQRIIDHFQNPRHYGEIRNPAAIQRGANLVCGDEITLFLKNLNESTHDLTVGVSSLDRTSSGVGKPATLRSGFYRDKNGPLKFTAKGCAISIAAASILIEKLNSTGLNSLQTLTNQQFLDDLAVPLSPTRLKCALLPLTTARLLVKN